MQKFPKIPKTPIFSTPNVPLVSTTQAHLPVAAIQDGIVLYKDGGAAVLLESTSLNFGLLSDREQEAVVSAYAALINSLSFSIQIVIRTQRKDISSYISYINEAEKKILNEKLKRLMVSYKNFVLETTKKRNVLGKRFFLIIPFSPLELGVSQSFKLVTNKSKSLPYTKEYILKKVKVALFPKRDHLVRQGARLGLRLRPLEDMELIELFYNVYNPSKDTVREKQDPADEEKSIPETAGTNSNNEIIQS